MKLIRRFRKILFCLFIFSLVISYQSFGENMLGFESNYPFQDTIITDTTGSLHFPFKDQPAFGQTRQDSSKLFLNKPSNIRYEVEYDPISGQVCFLRKNWRFKLPPATNHVTGRLYRLRF